MSVHNERVKLAATFLNTVAAAGATVGVIAPFSNVLLKGETASLPTSGYAYVIFWLTIAAILHGAAQHVLKGIQE